VHEPQLGVPAGLRPTDELFCVRFTGEVFAEYE
jgi:hypothetical protein